MRSRKRSLAISLTLVGIAACEPKFTPVKRDQYVSLERCMQDWFSSSRCDSLPENGQDVVLGPAYCAALRPLLIPTPEGSHMVGQNYESVRTIERGGFGYMASAFGSCSSGS
jgi:hypothetical protein